MYILGVQTRRLQLDAVSCIPRLCLPNTISQSICLSHISLMATFEHGDEAEIAASIHHSPEKPALEPTIKDATLQGSPRTVLDTLDETTRERETLSASQISGAIFCYHVSIQNLILPSSECFCAQVDDSKL